MVIPRRICPSKPTRRSRPHAPPPVHWRCVLANPRILCSQCLTKSHSPLPLCHSAFLLKPSAFLVSVAFSPIPFSFLISVVEMAAGKQSFRRRDSRGRFCSEEEKAPPAAPTKRVRFRGEEVGSLSAMGRRLYTRASANGVHSGDTRQAEAEPSSSLVCLKLGLCLKLNSWYSSYAAHKNVELILYTASISESSCSVTFIN